MDTIKTTKVEIAEAEVVLRGMEHSDPALTREAAIGLDRLRIRLMCLELTGFPTSA